MWGKSISLQQILTPEKRIRGLADCHTSPGKWEKVISFEINPFTVNILKHREKVVGGGGEDHQAPGLRDISGWGIVGQLSQLKMQEWW